MTSIHIRDAKPSDHTALAELYLFCRERTFHWMPQGHFKRSDFLEDIQGERCLIAERNGQIAGFISVWVEDSFIHHLYIHPDFQGQGVGPQLLESALTFIDSPARLKCIIRNEKACRFYESLGWNKESVGEDSPIGPYINYRLDFI